MYKIWFAIYGTYFPIFSRGIETIIRSWRKYQLFRQFCCHRRLSKTEGLNSICFVKSGFNKQYEHCFQSKVFPILTKKALKTLPSCSGPRAACPPGSRLCTSGTPYQGRLWPRTAPWTRVSGAAGSAGSGSSPRCRGRAGERPGPSPYFGCCWCRVPCCCAISPPHSGWRWDRRWWSDAPVPGTVKYCTYMNTILKCLNSLSQHKYTHVSQHSYLISL